MALPNITTKYHTVSDIQYQHSFTVSWVRGHPAGAPHRQGCEDFQSQITKSLQTESDLQQKVNDAFVRSFLMDRDLDELVKKILALLPVQKDQDPAVLQERLLEGLPPSKFVRPILGGQLKAMKGWAPVLRASSHSELQALGSEVEAKTTLATKLEEELSAAEKELDDFLTLGGRAKLFTDFNTLRNTIHKGIGKDHPELAEEFFLHDTTRTATLDASLQSTQAKIERLQSALESEQKKLTELQAKKASRDAEESDRQLALIKLAEIKQQKAALKQQETLAKAKAKGKKK